jgi:hypothetical protein
MADNDEIINDDAPQGVDPSTFVPETFKTEDGAFDVAKFRESYDELASFKSTQDEAKASLPAEPGEYAFALGEDHVWPEGFDPEKMGTTDAEGNELAFDPSKIFDPEDPDVPLVQSLLHEIGAPKEAMNKIAGIMANREIRQIMQASETAEAEKKALGPDAQARIDTVKRTLSSRMEAEQATALLDGITSANALRGIEKLIKNSVVPPSPAGTKPDYSQMSPLERVMAGNQQRQKRA